MELPDEHRLAMTLSNVRRGVAPSPTAPYWKPEGDWTFFDAAVEDDPNAAFTVGVGPLKDGAFGKLLLVPGTRESGTKLVATLARAFEVTDSPVERSAPLAPVEFGYTWLGHIDTVHQTKWFPSVEGRESEVYFNFDLKELKGEFLEKDEDYNDQLLRMLATALRDGRSPELTPESDARVPESGPRFADIRPLDGQGFLQLQGLRENEAVFIERAARGGLAGGERLVAFDLATGQRKELAQVNGIIQRTFHCVVPTPRWLLHEVAKSQDPANSVFWLLEGGQLSRVPIKAPLRSPSLTGVPLSPDGRFVALAEWEPCTQRQGNYAFLAFLDLTNGNRTSVSDGEASLSVVGWAVRDGKVLAAAEATTCIYPDEHKRMLDIDPETGRMSPSLRAATPLDWRGIVSNPLAPGGDRRAELKGGTLVIEDLSAGSSRSVELPSTPSRAVRPSHLEWVSERYLVWRGPARLSFIDSTTGKLSFPLPRDDDRIVSVAPGFRYAVLSSDGAWFIARVVCHS